MAKTKKPVHIYSMTGYGESSYESTEVYLHVSIKTVNSKYLDIDANLPRAFAQQEIAWRKLFAAQLKRGRVFFSLTCQIRSLQANEVLNEELLKAYSSFLEQLCTSPAMGQGVLSASLRLPGVIRSEITYNVSEEVKRIATQTVAKSLDQCLKSRAEEGIALTKQLQQYVETVRTSMTQLDHLIAAQQASLRNKLQERVISQELMSPEWEQDITTYLNKTSIEEEKVRINNHLDFFEQTLAQAGVIGKKLGFIVQELSRELNTMGAKAQYSPLQHLVVNMKEVVEQMREQTANLV